MNRPRPRIISSEELNHDVDTMLFGHPHFYRKYYEGNSILFVFGPSFFCLQLLEVEKMGKFYGIKIGPFCFYFRFRLAT